MLNVMYGEVSLKSCVTLSVECCDVLWCVVVGGVSVCFVRGGGLCNGESDSWQPGAGLPGYGRHCSTLLHVTLHCTMLISISTASHRSHTHYQISNSFRGTFSIFVPTLTEKPGIHPLSSGQSPIYNISSPSPFYKY